MSETTSTRELLIVIRTELDKTAGAHFKQVGQMAKDAQNVQTQAAKAAAGADAAARRQSAAAHKEWERDASASYRSAARAQEKAVKEQIRSQKEWEREATQSYRNAQREQDKLNKAAEHSGLKVAQNSAKMLTGITKAAVGVEKMARGFVLLGVASEEDLQKAVQMMAAFEGGLSIMKGMASVLKGTTMAWKGYTASVALAAAAEKARAAAGGVGTAASIGKAAVGIGASVAGTAATGAGAAGVGSVATGIGGLGVAATGAGASLAAIAVPAALVAGALYLLYSTTQDAKKRIHTKLGEDTEGPGAGSRVALSLSSTLGGGASWALDALGLGNPLNPKDQALKKFELSNKKLKGKELDAANKAARKENDLETYRQTTSDFLSRQTQQDALEKQRQYAPGIEGLEEKAAAAKGHARTAGMDAYEAGGKMATYSAEFRQNSSIENARMAATAQEAYIHEVERAKQAEQEAGEAAIAVGKARMQLAQTQIGNLKEQISLHKQMANEGRSKQEQFAALDPVQQQRLKWLRQRFDKGENLRGQELGELKPWMGKQSQRKASDAMRGHAEKAGFKTVFGEEEWGQEGVENQEAMARKLEAKVKVQQDYTVKLEWDERKLVSEVSDQINTRVKQAEQSLKSALGQALSGLVRAENDQIAMDQARRSAIGAKP